jgi:hypothetical protein
MCGSFSRAGRFCYWLQANRTVPIAQKKVNYVHRFQGMTRQKVRDAVYDILNEKFRDTGEV